MNEITRIHLARVAYDIEIGAKKELDTYLKDIKTALNNDETLLEVEQRMSEILLEQSVKPGGVITARDVKAIRQQLGEPSEFGDDAQQDTMQPMPRRLMRDMERKQIAGVAAGLGAYFGAEVVIVRLVFILLTLVNGLGLLLYFVLWAIMPPARSLSDRLSLRGEVATLDAYKEHSGSPSVISTTPSWLLALGRWVLGLGLLFVGWLPIVIGTIGTVVTFTHQNSAMYPTSVLGWVVIVAAWAGALAFSVFMTTLGLAILGWSFARVKWPLVVSGVVMLLAGTVIAAGGPIIVNEVDTRDSGYTCEQAAAGRFEKDPCDIYMTEGRR